MGTVPQMGLGEFYRELRGSRLVKQKDVVRGDFTAAQLSRFESGKSMLAADKLITAVEGINMTMEEFTYKYHGYKEAPHIELANLISDLYYRQDRAGLEALLESDLLKAEGNLYARLNGIVIKVALAALDGQSDFDDEDREFLSDYLFAIEEWTSFELYLFLNAQMLLNEHMIVSLLSELKNKSKSYRNLRKHRDYLKKILINSVGEMIERKKYGLAEEFLTELERLVETTDAFEQIFVNYFKLCIALIKSGSSLEFQTKTEAYIASVGLIVSNKVSMLLERHYKLCVLKEDC
ncbi:Rgg/GadR/MutR family transcriptional regulator [Streptococcus suis]|uniref:Rgg/GadR/MutR family transcriptional regulator n=1 Tax=Streptococcus suis TaxID=1307 RepID=UPI000CF5A5A6|nr:Rgg/GadR/MutR family transcriptional regulator [Streptococcus suis]MCO8205961.1 Rgg/GadR/MutR family transcriptional regulator [Streptococcus suis]MCO8231426.1 Rgg/GadR/MutR family transcriptional regulator [Streptococcus suis]HEM3456200.1 Rgg/GadR/MutR family transcriptional regulator [Streptococcus suis]HEM3550517.1 Rgg/GadR/MutR family transcriptional regulator [Streptococcus suis]